MESRKRLRWIRMLCLSVMAVCLLGIGRADYLSARNQAKQEALREAAENPQEEAAAPAVQSVPPADSGTQAEADISADKQEPQENAEDGDSMLERYQKLYQENNDLAGWLSIEGMKIDYPVMQCEDDEYYLHHDFEGKDSKYGCLYVRECADLEEGTNFLIYGHNMKDGSMFGDLDLYREEAFYREHSRITFDTLYREHSYEIVSVFLSQIYEEDDNKFKYYQFYDAETEEEFLDFYENIKAMALYDTGVEASYGDTFLTLSTCAYHVTNGRLAVVAKRVD
ncbi:MAG: class B sortase [Bacteroidales bacterium]|nr:class B sortase [Bacteroidales bacterium]MCM1424542.1 class B sortase [bacterium]